MKEYISQFDFDKEGNVTLSLANFLDKNDWEVIACHPPGGHTSFSILDGRRSKGGFMPDVVAIKHDPKINDFIVIIAESKSSFQQSTADIQKLLKLSIVHAQWIAFRLQKNIDSEKWISNWGNKLQKLIAFTEGEFNQPQIPKDTIAIKFSSKDAPKIFIGSESPAKDILFKKTFPNK